MVRKAIDYATREMIFYRFVCNDPNIINTYVGSTLDFIKRKYKHKSSCNTENSKKYHYLIYKTIRDNGGWDNWRMLVIERKLVKDKTESLQIEQYWIEYYNAQMNMKNAKPDENYYKEYYEQNRDKAIQYYKKYCEQNRDKELQRKKEYYEKNKKSINEYQREYRHRQKELKLMSNEDKNIV